MAGSKKSLAGVKPHPLVQALQPDPGKPPARTIKLFGFPGHASEGDSQRLWLDTELRSFVDIPRDAIQHTAEMPNDSGTMVWVSPDAKLSFGSTGDATAASQFLSGTIASGHLKHAVISDPMPGVAGGAMPHAVSVGTPCLSLPIVCHPSIGDVCHPSIRCPSVSLPCASVGTVCPSQAVACHPSVAACHSVIGPCASVGAICPTHTVVCRPTVVGCPSVAVACVSHAVVCQISVNITCPSVHVCPTHICPSVHIPCLSATLCPTNACVTNEGPGEL